MSGAENLQAVLTADTHYGYIDRGTRSHRLYNPLLLDNTQGKTMLEALTAELRRSKSFKFAVAFITSSALGMLKQAFLDYEAYSKVPPAAKNTNPRTTANTRPYNPNGRLNPV